MRSYDEVSDGEELPARAFAVRRVDLVRYAGASGDHNVIHWNERLARSVGLPDVIAHGMYTMALATRFVTEWAGDPGAVVSTGVRFSAPVVVPDDDEGARVEVSGRVEERDAEARTVTVVVDARAGGPPLLKGARTVLRLA